MSKIKLMFSNAVYMFKVIWNFSKSLFLGKMLLAILNGVITLPLRAKPCFIFRIAFLLQNMPIKLSSWRTAV